jgi:hypothetical protein
MAATNPTGKQIKDGSVQRDDLDASTVGQAVIRKLVQGTGISLTSTGGDAGTGDVTVSAALGATSVGNANYTIVATDRFVYTTVTFTTSGKTWTLPAASAYPVGMVLTIADFVGINGPFTLSIARAGTDTINGGTASIVLDAQYDCVQLASDGVSKWFVVGAKMASAVSSSFWINAISSLGNPSVLQPAFSDITGVASAAQLPNPSSSGLGGIQSFAAVSKNWIRAISTAGVPTASQPATGDLSCEASTGAGAAGTIGEQISSFTAAGSGGNMTTATILNVNSISLTAGDWDISGFGGMNGAVSLSYQEFRTAWSVSATTMPIPACARVICAAVVIGTGIIALAIPTQRVSIASTTTHYLNVYGVFSGATPTGFGSLLARRVR